MPETEPDSESNPNGSRKKRTDFKRRKGFGAIRPRSGRLYASHIGPDGQRHNAPTSFTAKGDAEAWLAIQHAAIATNTWTQLTARYGKSADRRTLLEYGERWVLDRRRNGKPLAKRTTNEYLRLLRNVLTISDELATSPIPQLTKTMFEEWWNAATEYGNYTQASRAYGLARTILASAVEKKLMLGNPCFVEGGQNASSGKKVTPPTRDELDRIIEHIADRYRAMVMIGAWGGLRYGEITELRRSDVLVEFDEDGDVVRLRIDISRGVTYTSSDGFVVGPPKSEAGVRVVGMPPLTWDTIVEHLGEHTALRPEALLFPAGDGVTHLAPSTFYKHWYPVRDATGRPDLPFHATRHFGGTEYARAGATLKDTMVRLGHSSTGAAMRYQHAALDRDENLAAMMGASPARPKVKKKKSEKIKPNKAV
jgi:integrase